MGPDPGAEWDVLDSISLAAVQWQAGQAAVQITATRDGMIADL